MAYIYVPSSARCRFSDYPLPPATYFKPAPAPRHAQCLQISAEHIRFTALFTTIAGASLCPPLVEFPPMYDFIGKSDENTTKNRHFAACERNKIIFFCRSSYFAASFARLSSPPNEILTSTGPFCLLSVSVHFTPSPMSCFSAKIARLVS